MKIRTLFLLFELEGTAVLWKIYHQVSKKAPVGEKSVTFLSESLLPGPHWRAAMGFFLWGFLTDFFTYETTKSVVVKSWSVGIINRIVQLLIITYFVGSVIWSFLLSFFQSVITYVIIGVNWVFLIKKLAKLQKGIFLSLIRVMQLGLHPWESLSVKRHQHWVLRDDQSQRLWLSTKPKPKRELSESCDGRGWLRVAPSGEWPDDNMTYLKFVVFYELLTMLAVKMLQLKVFLK